MCLLEHGSNVAFVTFQLAGKQAQRVIIRCIPLREHAKAGLHNHLPVYVEPCNADFQKADLTKVDDESNSVCPVWDVPEILGQTSCLPL